MNWKSNQSSPRTHEIHVQHEQLARYNEWVAAEGGVEQSVHEETYLEPCQLSRTNWLVTHTLDTPNFEGTKFKSILEVGCSGGHQLLAVNGEMGIDLNPQTIAATRKEHPERRWMCWDITNGLPQFSRQYHTVLLPDILEHLMWSKVEFAIAEAKRVASKRVIITIPDGLTASMNQRNWGCFKHRWVCTLERLNKLLNICELIPRTQKPWRVQWETDGAFIYITCERP